MKSFRYIQGEMKIDGKSVHDLGLAIQKMTVVKDWRGGGLPNVILECVVLDDDIELDLEGEVQLYEAHEPHPIHDMELRHALAHISAIEDTAVLEEMRRAEERNPNADGGRSGLLAAIDWRIKECLTS